MLETSPMRESVFRNPAALTPLGNKQIGGGHTLPLQFAECSDFGATNWMYAVNAVLESADVQKTLLQIQLVPPKRA
jgi:hypothetical protein